MTSCRYARTAGYRHRLRTTSPWLCAIPPRLLSPGHSLCIECNWLRQSRHRLRKNCIGFARVCIDFARACIGFARPYIGFARPYIGFARPYIDFARPRPDIVTVACLVVQFDFHFVRTAMGFVLASSAFVPSAFLLLTTASTLCDLPPPLGSSRPPLRRFVGNRLARYGHCFSLHRLCTSRVGHCVSSGKTRQTRSNDSPGYGWIARFVTKWRRIGREWEAASPGWPREYRTAFAKMTPGLSCHSRSF